MPSTIEHRCPNCGATVEFDIGTQKVSCAYCGSEYDPNDFLLSDEDAGIDIDSINLPDNGGEQWEEEEISSLNEYSCSSCGSNIYADDTTSATLCPYCGNAVILRGRLSGFLRPDRVIPFKQTKEQALKGLDIHCRKRRFVPKSFKEDNRLEEVKGLYVPYWVYDADLEADMHYTGVKETLIASGKNTDVVERKYYRVRRKGKISFDNVPADASSKMADDLMESIEPFDHSESMDFNTAYLSGYVADKYDVEQLEASERVRERMIEEVDDMFRTTITGYDEVHMRESNIETVGSNVEYTLYPVWLFNLDWKGERYTYAMNGQTGKVAGDLPVDNIKLRAFGLVIFGLLMLGAWFSLSAEFNNGQLMEYMFYAALVCGFIEEFVVFFFKSELKTVEARHGSKEYYREGSMSVEESEDEFLYKKIETKRSRRSER